MNFTSLNYAHIHNNYQEGINLNYAMKGMNGLKSNSI
jgi:hypothetical protein